jgi:hypothetical protein
MRRRDAKSQLFLWGSALAILALFALNVQAEPINDGALGPYRAGWFPNNGPQGPLSCTDTCKAKAPGTVAEHAPSAAPVPKRAFVCRAPGKPKGNLQTWLYGSQFDDRPACYTTGLDLKGSFAEKYFCLCVAK